jgi:YEATS family
MAEWIPLFQTLVWPTFIVSLLLWFGSSFATILAAIGDSIRKGAPFAAGPSGLSIGSPPAELARTGEPGVGVTAEGIRGSEKTQPIVEALERNDLPTNVVESPYLIHEAQVIRPRTDRMAGLYRVRVSLESDPADDLNKVNRVTYRLHPTFPNRIIATEAREKNFELWLNVYGEFTIIAVVERDGQPPLWLTRYLELPGRPPE